jgi:inner membrane protein
VDGALTYDFFRFVSIPLYHPVLFGGSTVRLHYARAGDLDDYLKMVAIRGEVVELKFSGGESDSTPGVLEEMVQLK